MSSRLRSGLAGIAVAMAAVACVVASPAAAEFSVSAQTQAAVTSINPTLTGDARAAALESAFQSVLSAAIAAGVSPADAISELALDAIADGVDATTVATAITLAATAPGSVISPRDLGLGFGSAAATLEKGNDQTDAMKLASVLANIGPDGSQAAFASAVTAKGGSTQLADSVASLPQVENGLGNERGSADRNLQSAQGSNGTSNGVNSSCPSNNPSCNS